MANCKFYCPHCEGRLDIHNFSVFTAKNKQGKLGLLLLSPHLGEYDVWHDTAFTFNKGDLIEYYCPVCHKTLTAHEFHDNLVKVNMVDENNVDHTVVFSGVAGEHATYRFRDKEYEQFGPYAHQYENFFQDFRY